LGSLPLNVWWCWSSRVSVFPLRLARRRWQRGFVCFFDERRSMEDFFCPIKTALSHTRAWKTFTCYLCLWLCANFRVEFWPANVAGWCLVVPARWNRLSPLPMGVFISAIVYQPPFFVYFFNHSLCNQFF